MLPIKYQVVGEEDYAFLIIIDQHGKYSISSGRSSLRSRNGGD